MGSINGEEKKKRGYTMTREVEEGDKIEKKEKVEGIQW